MWIGQASKRFAVRHQSWVGVSVVHRVPGFAWVVKLGIGRWERRQQGGRKGQNHQLECKQWMEAIGRN